jgi:hypothetical protein
MRVIHLENDRFWKSTCEFVFQSGLTGIIIIFRYMGLADRLYKPLNAIYGFFLNRINCKKSEECDVDYVGIRASGKFHMNLV